MIDNLDYSEAQEILEKILNKPIKNYDTLGLSQSLCLAYLAGDYQEWEKEIKQLATVSKDT